MEKRVLFDLANEATRKYGDLPADFAPKMARRIRRKFSVRIEPEKIRMLAIHYKEVYGYAKSILGEFLGPPKGKYANAGDVDTERLLKRLSRKFAKEDIEILRNISNRVIYFEYLR